MPGGELALLAIGAGRQVGVGWLHIGPVVQRRRRGCGSILGAGVGRVAVGQVEAPWILAVDQAIVVVVQAVLAADSVGLQLATSGAGGEESEEGEEAAGPNRQAGSSQ